MPIMQSIKNEFTIKSDGNTYQPEVIYYHYGLPWDPTKRYIGLFYFYRKIAEAIGPLECFVGCRKEYYDHHTENAVSIPWRFAPISRQKYDDLIEIAKLCPISLSPQGSLRCDGGEFEFHVFQVQKSFSIAWSGNPDIGWHSLNIITDELQTLAKEAFPDL